MKIEKISWDQETVDHISNHLVSPEEVEEVLFNEDEAPIIMRGKEGKYLAYGKTHGGRLLLIVWASKYKKTKIITARDMTEKEKRFYRRRKE
ncbi:MAG: BrnT family toxin [Deltaproteobacteria bacterium]|nr:BrnT family toxin [Deltaproteobacteria bacterium]